MSERLFDVLLDLAIILGSSFLVIAGIVGIAFYMIYQTEKDENGTKTMEKPGSKLEEILRENSQLFARHQIQYDHLRSMFDTFYIHYEYKLKAYARYLKRKEARIVEVGEEQWRREANDDLHAMVSVFIDRAAD